MTTTPNPALHRTRLRRAGEHNFCVLEPPRHGTADVENLERHLADADRAGRLRAGCGDCRVRCVHRHGESSAPKSSGRALCDAVDSAANVDRRGEAGPTARPCGLCRAESAGTVGGGWRPRRHRLGRRLRLGESREDAYPLRQACASGSVTSPRRSPRPGSDCCGSKAGCVSTTRFRRTCPRFPGNSGRSQCAS